MFLEDTDVTTTDETVTDSSSETNEVDNSTDVSDNTDDTTVSDDVKTQDDAATNQSVPRSRLNQEIKKRRELEALLQSKQSTQTEQTQGADPQAQAKQNVEAILGFIRESQVKSQIEDARNTFPDFDQHMTEVTQILSDMPHLKQSPTAVREAYLIAKGLMADQSTSDARKEGVQQAYQKMDQKQAGRTTRPVPAKTQSDGKSDLLKRYQSGQMSQAEIAQNWSKIVEETTAQE